MAGIKAGRAMKNKQIHFIIILKRCLINKRATKKVGVAPNERRCEVMSVAKGVKVFILVFSHRQ